MNHKTKFGKIPIGEVFTYNGVLFTKHSAKEGISQRIGKFEIADFESVFVAESVTRNETPITFWGPFGVLVYLIACAPFIMLLGYVLVQWLWSAQ